jgi:hypothetical protein
LAARIEALKKKATVTLIVAVPKPLRDLGSLAARADVSS